MQRWSAEDRGDARKRSVELKRGRKQFKRPQGEFKYSLKNESPEQFIVCINLGDVPSENVNATITGRTVNITGEQVESIEEDDGMIRQNYQGFSNTFNIPPEVNIDTLNLTICEKHTLLVEADYFENNGALEEYITEPDPRQSRLKSLNKLSSLESSSVDLASPTNTSSELSRESLYETALTHPPSKKSLTAFENVDRKGSAALIRERGVSVHPDGSRRPLIQGKTQSMDERGSESHPVESRRSTASPKLIQNIQEEDRRGSILYQDESRRPFTGRERTQYLNEEGKKGSVSHPVGSRSSMSAERIQNKNVRRGSISHPGEKRRTSMSQEKIQDTQKEGKGGSAYHLKESRRSFLSPEKVQTLHGEERINQDQSRGSSKGRKKQHSVHAEGKRSPITNQGHSRSSAGRERTHSVHGKGKGNLKSHREEARLSMKKESKSTPAKRESTEAITSSTDSYESSLDSSDSTISKTSNTSWISDEFESTRSIPTSMQTQASIADTSGLSPKSTRDSFSSQQDSSIRRSPNRIPNSRVEVVKENLSSPYPSCNGPEVEHPERERERERERC
ncbi:EF-hand calcium-binding domain-containing protein 5-like isoform X2 [Narcine bancroftii]|uniref:EF-hand calcium-binding domain-containing protein 5-like isoform X2 n=1 Tax=Narcine bancroftii TaxID=1343680 RepID=UPI00383202DB